MKAKLSLIFLLLLIIFLGTVFYTKEILADDLTGACTTTDTDDVTSCEVITRAACTTNSGIYEGDGTTCEEDTTEKVNMGSPTSDNTEFDFARSLLLNNANGNSGSNLVKNHYFSVGAVVNLIIRYLFLAGGVVFFALILISGYKLVFLGDKQKALSDVKKNLTTGVLGLLIMFAVFWIIRIIETLTGLSILGAFGL